MRKFQISANGQFFGAYDGATEQDARDACAIDAGYKSESDMIARLKTPSDFEAVQIVTERRVNERGLRYLADWINATANEDHRHTDPRNLDAWANEAEEAMGNGNPPMVEMQAPATLSGVPETFTIPADGVYEQGLES